MSRLLCSTTTRRAGLLVCGLLLTAVTAVHGQLLGRLSEALLHESDVARNDPNPTVGHRLIAYNAGLPKSVI